MVARVFTTCPRCGGLLQPCIAIDGSVSDSWKKCCMCNTYVNTYVPQAHQAAVHGDSHTFTGNFGGYGTGKTTTSRQEFYKHLFITPNGNTLIGANVTSQYEQTIKRDIESDLPQAFVRDTSTQKAYIDFINGHRLMYRPLDDEGKLRSYTLSMFIIVEASEVDADIYAQLQTRLRSLAATKQLVVDGVPQFTQAKNGNLIPVIEHAWLKGIVESNPDAGWIRNDLLLVSDKIEKHGGVEDTFAVMEQHRDPAVSSHVAATDVNAFLPPNFIAQITKNKPDWWVRRYVKGSFTYAEGLVYPSALKHVVPTFEVPKHWKRMLAFDYGLSDDAVYLYAAIDEEKGIVYFYKEQRVNNRNIEDLARLFWEGTKDIPMGGIYKQPIIDPKSVTKRDYNMKSLGDHFLDYGISFMPGQVSVDARVFKVNTYLESGRVKIMDCCTGLIEELRDYKFPAKKLGNTRGADKPVDKNNHGINPMEWIIMELPKDPTQLLYGVYNREGIDTTRTPAHRQVVPWNLRDDDEHYDDPHNTEGFFGVQNLHNI